MHCRPRHPVRRRDLGLVAPVGHRPRKAFPQPGRGAHSRRHLPDPLGERLLWTVLRAAPPAPLAPLHRHRHPATGQILRARQHPLLGRRRDLPATRAPGRVRITRHQLNDLDPTRGKSDTLHRQSTQSQQTRRIIATVDHGPWLSSRCSRTQRGSRSHGPPSFRRAEPSCPVKIGEPLICIDGGR